MRAPGAAVRTRVQPPGHTRLPGYAAAREGVVHAVRGRFPLPDVGASGEASEPRPLYSVRFDARTLWGAGAEPATVFVDLFEDYLEP